MTRRPRSLSTTHKRTPTQRTRSKSFNSLDHGKFCKYIEELTNFIKKIGYLDLEDGRFNFYRWYKSLNDKDPVLCSKWACDLRPVHETNLRLVVNFNKNSDELSDICSNKKCCMTGFNHFLAVRYDYEDDSCLVICNYEDISAYIEIRLYLFYLEYKQRSKYDFDSRLDHMNEYAYTRPEFQMIIDNIDKDPNEIRTLIKSL